MTRRCLYCYQLLDDSAIDFHFKCSKAIFGEVMPPVFAHDETQLSLLAKEIINSHMAVTGVQPKLSLHISDGAADGVKRFTIVGLWGGYILKPPTQYYPQLPEVEDLVMHLAGLVKIKTVPHSLIRLQSGNLAYITKRIDRNKAEKLHMEDMCQITQRLTEHKYQGSYEQVAKAIRQYSTYPGLDLVNFCELLLFCFFTGNADMHLKNFSLIQKTGNGMGLAPAYDLVATALVNPADREQVALTLNGRKNRLKRSDFEAIFNSAGLTKKQQEKIFDKLLGAKRKWLDFIDISFLSAEFKQQFKDIIEHRTSIMEQK